MRRYRAIDVAGTGLKGEVHAARALEGRAIQDAWIMPRCADRGLAADSFHWLGQARYPVLCARRAREARRWGEQQALAATVADLDGGRVQCPLGGAERFDLVLGITCHAVYHAGQIQLIKVLADR